MTPERFDLRARTEGVRIVSEGRTPSSTKKQLLSLVGMRGLTSKEMLGSSVSFRATAAESAALEAIKAELGDLWLPLLTSPTGAFAKTQANERLLNTAKLAENGFDFTNFEAKDIDLMTVKIQDWGDLSVGQQTKLLKAAGLDKSSLPLVSRNQTILNLMTL